jgi:hypothetical protein
MQDYDHSNRSALLAEAVLPYLRAGDSILDVGCGFAAYPKFQGTILPRLLKDALDIRYHGIDHRADVIAECRNMYPEDEWTVTDAALFVPGRKYDAVFHLGFDRKDLSNAWKIHANLEPRVVLLEAGAPAGHMSGHVQSFYEVGNAYVDRGYVLKASGRYVWTYKVTQPDRRYSILERP